ncbi:unnamed protein product [Aphanomyces euteiches]|uniref:ABM domain-containing protein n=1 Tax=Aphanomyces euteiches TaxID=100861 RepID=A0A6G0WFM8_9STRA|nr:hypothetical protein Ae201684_016235 [Aphanomyces euteiches]KAH9095282.1 hypothetical protein Ae201684P_013398 [Aphanomyces euteiches]KAH9122986.1 hypothetical protein AeMF1_005917 [Aphanomyces euteiches]KAH9153511.1 hypothetical protein AeRB84_004257 [Aphanomyces euteiches]
MPTGPIRVLTERLVSRGFEPTVARFSEQLRAAVKKQPGFISIESLDDLTDLNKHVMISQWRSKEEYLAWEQTQEYKKLNEKLNEVLDKPGKSARIFSAPKEDVFLL